MSLKEIRKDKQSLHLLIWFCSCRTSNRKSLIGSGQSSGLPRPHSPLSSFTGGSDLSFSLLSLTFSSPKKNFRSGHLVWLLDEKKSRPMITWGSGGEEMQKSRRRGHNIRISCHKWKESRSSRFFGLYLQMDPERHRFVDRYCDQNPESLKAWPSNIGTKGKRKTVVMRQLCTEEVQLNQMMFICLLSPSPCEAAFHRFKSKCIILKWICCYSRWR